MFRSRARQARTGDRRCLHCGTPLRLVAVEATNLAFCSASCVFGSERLRVATLRTMGALRAEAKRKAVRERRRRSRTRREFPEPEDDASTVVVAMRAAGATVWQIARYTTLETSEVDRILERRAS